MGQKELLRGKVLEQVKRKNMTLKAASLELKISYRQAKRIYRRYVSGGDKALIHGNVGKPSNRKTEAALVEQVTELYRKNYGDFGPTFAAEKMEEREGIKIPVSTLRRMLLDAELWERKRRSSEYRSRRDRRECFGELIQFDGSHHDWFEGRGPKCCLITLIDDATNTRLSLFFDEETMFGAMTVLKLWIERFGIPQALYCDKKNAFVLIREPTDAELLKGITEPKSYFGRACEKLGIEVIAANSPQAKGRVENNHKTDQDRLVKELRLAGISTIEEANTFLAEYYLPKMNKKFYKEPKRGDDAHAPLGKTNLDDILCEEHERVVTNDYVVRYQCHLYQITKTNRVMPRPKDKVTVRVRLDYSLFIVWKGKNLRVTELTNITEDAIHLWVA